MKRILVILVALLAISSLAFAQTPTLPDYRKDGKLNGTWTCDAGKTVVRGYSGSPWNILEIRLAQGDILVYMDTEDDNQVLNLLYFIKDNGSSEAKAVRSTEFDKVFAKRAPMAFIWFTNNDGWSIMEDAEDAPNDCRKK